MDKLSVIGKIGTILSDLKEQQEYFEKNLQSLNEVEVELFAASANYLAEYAKVLRKFPASRATTPSIPPQAVAQAAQQYEEEDIGFRLRFEEEGNFEEDEKKIHQPGASGKQKLQVKEESLAEKTKPDPQQRSSGDKTDNSFASREAIAETLPDREPSVRAPEKPSPQAASESEEPVKPAAEKPSPQAASESEEPVKPAAEKPFTQAAPKSEEPVKSVPEEHFSPEPRQPVSPAPEVPFSPAPETPRIPAPTSPAPDSGASQDDAEAGKGRKMSLNERFGAKKTTLYERMAPKQPEKESGSPITNLGRSIGINERYYFIKTLFHDDKVAFDQAITRIDMCHSLGEALEYTNKSLTGKYSWSRKEEDARKFYDLLKRRFV